MRLRVIPNIRQCLRFRAVLRLETVRTGPRAQPSWFSSWACLNPSNSPFSPLTGARLLIGRLREAGHAGKVSNSLPAVECTDANHLPGPDALERGQAFRNDWEQVLDPVRAGTKNHNRNANGPEILLEGQVLVERQQDIELRIGQRQQLTVLLPRPTALDDRAAFVTLGPSSTVFGRK